MTPGNRMNHPSQASASWVCSSARANAATPRSNVPLPTQRIRVSLTAAPSAGRSTNPVGRRAANPSPVARHSAHSWLTHRSDGSATYGRHLGSHAGTWRRYSWYPAQPRIVCRSCGPAMASEKTAAIAPATSSQGDPAARPRTNSRALALTCIGLAR